MAKKRKVHIAGVSGEVEPTLVEQIPEVDMQSFYSVQGLHMLPASATQSIFYGVREIKSGNLVSAAGLRFNWPWHMYRQDFKLKEAEWSKLPLLGGVLTPPKYRSKGYATKLIEAIIEDHPTLFLQVKVDNPSRRIYERLGFEYTTRNTPVFGQMIGMLRKG